MLGQRKLVQFGRKEEEWEGIAGKNQYGQGHTPVDKISFSVHRNAKSGKSSLCIAFPRALMNVAGLRKGDRVFLKWRDGLACITRADEPSRGIKISGTGGKGSPRGKLRITSLFNGTLEKRFFPNGEERYSCSVFETRPNTIEFTIGEAS